MLCRGAATAFPGGRDTGSGLQFTGPVRRQVAMSRHQPCDPLHSFLRNSDSESEGSNNGHPAPP